jgi:HK97 family phage major capsid protein
MKRYFLSQFQLDALATGGGAAEELKTSTDLLNALNSMKDTLENKAKADAKAEVTEQLKEVTTAIEELKNLNLTTSEEFNKYKEDVQAAVKAVNMLSSRVKAVPLPAEQKTETKSFNDILAETIERNAKRIQSYRKEDGLVAFDMLPELKEASKAKKEELEVKAVGDMSIATNFANAANLTQDIRTNLIESPYNRIWLSDIIPGGNTNGRSVVYPKENGGEGGVAAWTDPTADKAQMDLDLTSQTAYLKWLAGIVIVDREMLDDISWFTSYIQNKMLISLKTAENGFILNGTSDTNPVQGMLDVATAYDGTFTSSVDRIIDAAYGQIVEDTEEFYIPTHTILTPRDAVAVGLNKASGSGEYDLPNGSVAFANGRLQIGGLQNVTSTVVGSGNFLTFDARALMFIRRMLPELRMFEDAALAKKNKVMFRIEERATLAIFNNSAIVKGTLASAE